jgi:uncharacterized protein YdhG (YjbR/CyaY superfamily)
MRAKTKTRRPAATRIAAPKDIDEYLSRVPESSRGALQRLRSAIRSAAPEEASEAISYRIPAFRYKGRMLCWYAAFSGHCSLFPTAAVIDAFRDDLKGYKVSKGTVQFTVEKPLPLALIRQLVRAGVKRIEERGEDRARR